MISLLKISVSVLFLSYFRTLAADVPVHWPTGGEASGMGSVCIMKAGFWNSFSNQALLAQVSSLSLGLNYENRFGIRELGTSAAAVAVPAGKTALGAVLSRFGYAGYRRDMGGIACGLKISEKILAGVQADYLSERTPEKYSDKYILTFEAGMVYTPHENIRIGIHLFNPVPNSLRKSPLPSTLRFGVGSDLSTVLFAGAEAEMSTGGKLIVKTGMEYGAGKKLWIRCGFSTGNNSFSFGLGYLVKFARVDAGFVNHQILGLTSTASVVFLW